GSHELALAVYRVTKRFPADERYGLTSQTRRAAFSAAVNIVEGSSRRSAKEFRRFLDISLSSLTEVWVRVAVLTRSRFARGRGLVDPERPPEPRAVSHLAALQVHRAVATASPTSTNLHRPPQTP